VIVGNIGTVYSGDDIMKARREYQIYVDVSKNVEGSRCYGEPVTRLVDGEIVQEYDTVQELYAAGEGEEMWACPRQKKDEE
jgi:hypothetical protein